MASDCKLLSMTFLLRLKVATKTPPPLLYFRRNNVRGMVNVTNYVCLKGSMLGGIHS